MVQELRTRFPSIADHVVTAQVLTKLYQEKELIVTTENYSLSCVVEKNLSPKMYAQITISEGSKNMRTIRLPFTVGVFAPVLHTQYALSAGRPVTEDMFYTKKTNIIEHLSSVVYFFKDIQGQQLKTNVRQDQLVQRWMFAKTPVVSLGEIITVLVRVDDVELRMAAEVLQTGFVGDKIRVRLRPTKKVVLAKILAPGEYEVQL